MNGPSKTIFPFKSVALVVCAAFLLFYFIYFYLRIDARLIYQAQEPVFYFDRTFLQEFFAYPGGLLDLLGRFITQFFYFSWSGAVMMSAVFGLIALAGQRLVNSIDKNLTVLLLPWLPTLFFFVSYHDYTFPIHISVGFLVALVGAVTFIKRAPLKSWPRALLFLIVYIILYAATGGPALIFTAIVSSHDLIQRRQFILPMSYAFIAGLLPFFGFNFLFILPLQKSFFINLGDFPSFNSWPLVLAFFFYPLFILLIGFSRKIGTGDLLYRHLTSHKKTVILIRGVVLASLLVLFSVTSFQKKEKALWAMDYHARHGEWQPVIDVIQQGKLLDVYIGQFQWHRALYFTGRLCDSMFAIPQLNKSDALFLHPSVRHLFPLQYSDLYYDLGFINEAQHWAHEALSVTGDTPSNLKRLAEVYILKGETEVARNCLRRLQKSLWHKKWANRMWAALETADFSGFPDLDAKKSLMLTQDFIVIPTQPEGCLEELLAANAANKMAFEYNMATLMLNGKVGRLINRLDGFNHIPYSTMPRHIEEAILMYVANTGRRDFVPPGTGISQETISAFQNYVEITRKYSDAAAAYRELSSKFGGTFWFYASYIYKKES